MKPGKILIMLSLFTIMVGCSTSSKLIIGNQSPEKFQKEIKKNIEVNYLLYLPENYEQETKNYPLMLFLHGAGERGKNLQKVAIHGPAKLIKQGKKFPFIIVSPQCSENQWWDIESLDLLLKDMSSQYRVDENQIYLTGLSMGGYGTWAMAMEYPHRFAAIAPICGGGNPVIAGKIKHLPTWVFHGAKDDVVPLKNSQDMVDALKETGGDVKFTIYPEAQHDSWTETYNNPELYEWFLIHSRDSN
ncbi:prolyl oligopeptidase family serine peptidase [candidate division KSB1 bacterium]|nr:prolyl oligopeptidase family serine peptidase [candidate division KSB1 bacterium]